MTLTGSSSASTLSGGSGNYSFAGLASGGSYTVTPTRPLVLQAPPESIPVDVPRRAAFLGITLLTGCRLTALMWMLGEGHHYRRHCHSAVLPGSDRGDRKTSASMGSLLRTVRTRR